jgi:hypothetical protein
MISPSFRRLVRASLFALSPILLLSTLLPSTVLAQGAKKIGPHAPVANADADHEKQRAEWFRHGRVVPGKSAAELRYRAYQIKMQARAARQARALLSNSRLSNSRLSNSRSNSQPLQSTGGWSPLGPVPLASDATGVGLQNYEQVSGRATAVAIDPADPTGNTVYIGGAQGGVWQSTNAATSVADNVTWTPLTDDQATLSIGSIAIQPGNSNPSLSVILVGTGEADNSADSYFGLGMLRSANGGSTWTLIPTANSGTLSFSGLGGTRMAFSTASGQTNTVVAAMAATSEGEVDGALTSNTYRGLYTSTDAGQSWTYDSLFSGGTSEATSATSVVYNANAGLFFAALRYHGFYSSPDGLNWTALANQPGLPGQLSSTVCPQNYSAACPIYRGEISVVPGRNEMYVWFVAINASGDTVDEGIWQSENSGASWTPISDTGVTDCGDSNGCGVEQGFYNLELLAVPNGASATDLYAGAINLYKCSITSINATCANTPFMNLTHAYGCDPFGAPAHVHPDQHALEYTIPAATGADLMYFANDGGIYRALNGFTGLSTGSCTGTNLFDDLNQNLGSMTQFVGFSQAATDVNTILGGAQDNGSPATATATTSTSWGNVLSGDGGYNAIDPNTGDWYASNPDTGFGTLNIQECSAGVDCTSFVFGDNVVVTSGDVGGDDGAFYFPYILDPQSTSSLLVGTCRVWSGARTGGPFTALSLNFETFGTATCAGTEVNVIRAVAAGGPVNANGSQVIYATTDGLGPSNPSTPVGGNVWVTTNATEVSGTTSTFANVTLNGPGGSSINPNQFPISGVAIDTSDTTGDTAYVTVMGFTGGPGHVWQTTNGGASWTDYTGTGTNALPDSPVNAVVVDPTAHIVYVGTDVGAFASSTLGASWTEVGPIPNPLGGSAGFLPDVAVTALALFNSGGQKLLRASTYGRGVWQFNLLATPTFQIAVSNTPLTVFSGATANFKGALTAIDGYSSNVVLSCTAGTSSPPTPCTPSPESLPPTALGAAFSLNAGSGIIGDYYFNVQGLGTDPNQTTEFAPVTLHVVNVGLSAPSPGSITEPRGATSPPVSFQVTAQGTFSESVTLGCSFSPSISGAACSFSPGATVNLTSASPVNMTATVTVPATTPAGNYVVTLQVTTAQGLAPSTATFNVAVVLNPDFVLSEPTGFPLVNAGSTNTSGPISVASQDGFSGTVSLTCSLAGGSGGCAVSPSTVSTFPATVNVTVNATGLAAGGNQLTVQGVSGANTQTLAVPFSVADYSISGTQAISTTPGGQATASLTLTSTLYSGQVNATCGAGALPGTQCTITPQNPIVVASGATVPLTVTLNVPINAIPGTYNININTQDVSGEPSHSLTIALTVFQDFTIGSLTPSTQTVNPGQSATYNFSVLPVGAKFTNAVSLSCSGAPVASACSFTPNPVTPGDASAAVVMTIATTTTASAGNYTVVVTGTSGSLSHSTAVGLTLANSFQLAVTQPFPPVVSAGAQLSAKISLIPNYSGSVNATCNALALSGTQCTLSPANPIAISGSPVTITASINTPTNAVPGAYSISINVADATSGTPSQSVTLPFTVAQDYTIDNLSAASQTITAGQSIIYNLSVAPVGAAYSNAITLSCTGGPLFTGSCAFSPNPTSPLSGSNAAAVVMTVTSQAANGQLWFPGPWVYAIWLSLATIMVWAGTEWRRRSPAVALGMAIAAVCLLPSCGGGSNGSGSGNPGGNTQTTPITYTITVVGSPPSISQPAGSTVTLIVNP